MINTEEIDLIIAELNRGASQISGCRNFAITRSTLLNTLEHVGWKGVGVDKAAPALNRIRCLAARKATGA